MICRIAAGPCFGCTFDAMLVLHRMVMGRACQCHNCARVTQWFVKEPDTECSTMWGMSSIHPSCQTEATLHVDKHLLCLPQPSQWNEWTPLRCCGSCRRGSTPRSRPSVQRVVIPQVFMQGPGGGFNGAPNIGMNGREFGFPLCIWMSATKEGAVWFVP